MSDYDESIFSLKKNHSLYRDFRNLSVVYCKDAFPKNMKQPILRATLILCRLRIPTFLFVLSCAACLPVGAESPTAVEPAEQAHAEIWRRFIDKYDVMLDFTDLDGSIDLPTPEECRAGKPNALGWWSPIENGAMFGGSYLEMTVNRWEHTKSDADATNARRLMKGLLLLNSVSTVPGFVGRGVSTDGRSHFAMGSDDQTFPWFLGLWRFHQSDLATDKERDRIRQRFETTTAALLKNIWRIPAEAPFGTRGSYLGYEFDDTARKLFILRAMHVVTGNSDWEKRYGKALSERGGKEKLSRLEIAERGMRYWYSERHNWTSASSVGGLRGLWEMEDDPKVKAAFARGLSASAELAAKSLDLALKYDPTETAAFDPDWRSAMLPYWREQATQKDAQQVASQQLRAFRKASPQRDRETAFVREPAPAAWIVTLCPDPKVVRPHIPAIKRVIGRYDYSRLYYSTFFWVEGAWWRLKDQAK